MSALRYRSISFTGMVLASASPAALAVHENLPAPINHLLMYGWAIFIVAVLVGVYFMRSRDRKDTPVGSVLDKRGSGIHAVAPDTSVTDCVRDMNTEHIGAMLVMEGGRLAGIFTERDALKKVLDPGLDPNTTRVSEVMTTDLHTIGPATTVGEAMAAVTQRRIRHLPVMDAGNVVAMISSGDLTHWLVADQAREIQEFVDVAGKS